MSMDTIAINPNVKLELAKDFTLYALYRKWFGGYDCEIDPLHNPDYRARRRQEEVKNLEKARKMIEECRGEFEELKRAIAEEDYED